MSEQPSWAQHADAAIASLGIPGELLLARALLAGMQIKPYDNPRGLRNGWIASIDVEPGVAGLIGETPEQLAYRWLERIHPQLVKPRR